MRFVRPAALLVAAGMLLAPKIVGDDAAASIRKAAPAWFCRLVLDPTNKGTRVMPPEPPGGFRAAAAASLSTITVQYTGFTPESQAAFQAAVDIWQSQLTSPVTMTVTASFSNLGSGSLLGQAGPTTLIRNFPSAPPSIWYAIGLANKIAGSDLNSGTAEIQAQFNNQRTDWYFGTDGHPPVNKIDFESVVLHELGHGLGFLGMGSVSGGLGTVRNGGFPSVYDTFTVDGSSRNLTNTSFFPDSSAALATALQGGNGGVFWTGANGVAASAGLPRLYAPSPWQQGSSYSHLDESTYGAGNPNSLMTPAIGFNEAIHSPGAIMLGMFQDMGWGAPPSNCTFTLSSSGATLPAAGGTGSVNLTTGNGCAWTATSSDTSIAAITSATSGSGSTTVFYSVAPNASTSPRFPALTIGGQAFAISQAGAPPPCSYSLSGSSASALSAGGTGTVTVTSQAGCAWTAQSNASFITITGGASGNGNGTVTYSVTRNGTSPRSGTMTIAGQAFTINQARLVRPMSSDFDGDGKSDLVVWRPGSGTWFWLKSSANNQASGAAAWGSQALNDVPLTGDIDGDGLADLIVWRPGTGTWFWLTSSTGYDYAKQGQKQWGAQSEGDVPMLGDVDGDGKADLIVWRASTGTFFWLTSSSGYSYNSYGVKQWGSASLGDRPFIADFDGDGKSDLAVWRASTGTWYWLTSSTGYNYANAVGKAWGSQAAGDVPLVGDIDGDGKADLAVWRAPSGTWFIITSSTGYDYGSQVQKQYGSQAAGDVPLLPDFDGDGKADLAVWRAPTGVWFCLTSSSAYASTAPAFQFGVQSDVPITR